MVLQQVSVWEGLVLLSIGFAGILLNAVQFKIVAKIFSIELNFDEWFGLSSINTMYNYLLPGKAGLAVRGVYLKKKYNFPYSHSASILAGTYLITLLITSIVATVLGLWFFLQGQLPPVFCAIAPIILLCIGMLLVFILKSKPNESAAGNRLSQFIKNTYQGLKFFEKHPRRFLSLCLLQLSAMVVNTIRIWFAFYLLHITINLSELLYVQSFVVFGTIVTVLPGNLIVKEGVIGFSAGFLAITLESALLGAVFDRVTIMLLVFLFGVVWSRILMNKLEHPALTDKNNE